MALHIRDFRPDDEAEVNHVALAAFEDFRNEYADWSTLSRSIGTWRP